MCSAMKIIAFVLVLALSAAGTIDACPLGKPDCGEAKTDVWQPDPDAVRQMAEEGWVKYEGNPVFLSGEEGQWDAEGVTCFLARHFPWGYMLWYSAGGVWSGFGLAQSEDGIHWTRHEANPVMVPDSGVTVWGPEVIHDGERYHMWFVSRGMGMDGISHCTSPDGVNWVQSENNPVLDHGGCNAVIWDGERYRMFLQHSSGRQHGFELLLSDDGENWESRGFTFLSGSVGSWDEITAAPAAAYYEGQLHFWYTGADTVGNRRGEIAIGHAVSDDWGERFTLYRDRTQYRILRPTEVWEGRGLYSSGVDYDGENIYIWYAATGPNGGFGYAARPVENKVHPTIEVDKALNLWSVSPNPAAGSVRLNYLGQLDAPVSVRLFDLSGRQLNEQAFAANQPIRLDPGRLGLPAGQYLISINAGGKELFKRLAVVR
ncbi:MAG: T9SS type A sorting domain-containing protein [Calditrichota bacterium]